MMIWTMESLFPNEASREAYQLDLNLLWRSEIVEANANLKAAIVVRETPLDLLLGIDSSRWLLARLGENALRLAALDIINALTDRSKGALTLDFLRRRALELCDPVKLSALDRYLTAMFAARSVPALKKRALQIRHKILAHTNAEHLRHPERFLETHVSRGEVEQLLEAAKELVLVLSFDVGRSFDFLPGDEDYSISDLVTEVVTKQSHVLRMPEEQPEVFPYVWQDWSPAEREQFNEWRTRTGRKPVDPPLIT